MALTIEIDNFTLVRRCRRQLIDFRNNTMRIIIAFYAVTFSFHYDTVKYKCANLNNNVQQLIISNRILFVNIFIYLYI